MTIEEIKAFFETNKNSDDVKNYLAELSKVTSEGVETFVTTEEGKKWLGKKNDAFFTKGLETWKTNNLDKLVSEGINKASNETPEQKRIRELEEKIAQQEKEQKAKDLLNQGLLVADEKKLPKDIVKFFVGEDEETTKQNLGALESSISSIVQQQVEQRLEKGYIPGGGNDGSGKSSSFAKTLIAQQQTDFKVATEGQKQYFGD